MPAGEIQLVAYGEENIVLNNEPQITFFKIMYRRYTNFSIETIQNNFLYQVKFGKKYSIEISKIGDLLHKMWLVVELPDIPIIYDLENVIDERIKFKWTQKVAYALIDYMEIEIGGQIIQRQWGEWLNVLNEFNWNNFNSSLDEYIGNTPEYTTYKLVKNGVNSVKLHIPLFFWFCNSSGLALPLLCLEYSIIRFNIQLNKFESCGIFSPSNYIKISKYYGEGILGEPIIQYSSQGVAWGEFDSVSVAEYNPTTLQPTSFYLYYRKISDNEFITTTDSYFTNIQFQFANLNNLKNYFIYGVKSGAIYVPEVSDTNDPNTIYIQKKYNFIFPSDVVIKQMYLLCDYIYLDREERTKFYQNKHNYLIEQIYFSNPRILTNLYNRNIIELINPCKYFVFMGQVKYFLNPNVNYLFNYKTLFFDSDNIFININLPNRPVIKKASFALNSEPAITTLDMSYYTVFNPFTNFPMSYDTKGFGLSTFSLYPDNFQPSGTCNMSLFNSFEINTYFNPIDIDYNNYVFKAYCLTYNYLRIAHGVCAPIFNSNF
jgi:hypothetical protein